LYVGDNVVKGTLLYVWMDVLTSLVDCGIS